jgi:bacterioferritin
MKKTELIDMLNRDLADEHAAIIRYLVHGWMEGEDTPIGASLISRSREEMWHMHWLGMIIGQLGGSLDFKPAPYPYDPTNRATIFRSYVTYEQNLIPHYNKQADTVDDPHIKRVLKREAWESAYHAKKFQRILDKLSPDQARTAPGGDRELPESFLAVLQREVTSKYQEMLQHIGYAWTFQKKSLSAWNLMDQAMEKMKQLSHFAEDIGGNGVPVIFKPKKIDISKIFGASIKKASGDALKSHGRHKKLMRDSEFQKHAGLVINLDLTLQQEEYQSEELGDMLPNAGKI